MSSSEVLICKLCQRTSEEVRFYDSYKSKCSGCVKVASRENPLKKPEQYRETKRRWAKSPAGEESFRRAHRKYRGGVKHEKAQARYRTSRKGRVNQLRYFSTEGAVETLRTRGERYPEKVAARKILQNAVLAGIVLRPEYCQGCGQVGVQLEAHHEDYDKPMDVIWMCVRCHKDEHRVW